ncbi:MAG TPA: sulfur oxidation c-type cytochrome SoxX [Usitatibacter sp.]|jgi:sulfur-oxidizing protein SoxX
MMGSRTIAAIAAPGMTLLVACTAQPIVDDALQAPLASAGDAARGREVFVSRDAGHCVLCHEAPGIDTFGNVGPSLVGVGSRLTVPQIRLRVADITKVSPNATMPTFHGIEQVKPVLTGQQVEDVVAWLAASR